jgi:fluoride ion exporter CrcB/FEX
VRDASSYTSTPLRGGNWNGGGPADGVAGRPHATPARLFPGVGFLGGYTTFSSYTFEALTLVEQGEWLPTVGYVLASNGLGLAAAYGGVVLGRAIVR